jgi:hypothetical protein
MKNSNRGASILHPAAAFACLLGVATSQAQTLPPISPEKLWSEGDRIEALVVLGGDNSAAGGAYSLRGSTRADLQVEKFGGGGDLGDPRPMGDSGIKWNPVISGNIGYVSATGPVSQAPLDGNTIDVSTFGIQFGGGARFWFNDHFSLAPSLSGLYGRTQQTFNALTDAGKQYLPAMQQAGWVDWRVDTWTAVPTLDLQYQWSWKRVEFQFNSTFDYYHTESFESTSPLLVVNGNSQSWKNTLDVDIPLGFELFGHEVHTGGFIDQNQLFGNVREGLETDHIYTVNGRLVLDFLGTWPIVRWMGLGASYFWSGNFSGWAIGIDIKMKF